MGRERGSSPTITLLVLFAAVFVLQGFVLASSGRDAHAELFMLSMPLEQHPWTVVTNVYAHGSLGHLVANAIGLAMFGFILERGTPSTRFHWFFLASGAVAGIAQVWFTAVVTKIFASEVVYVNVLGASGAIFALLGYLLSGNRLTEHVVGGFRLGPKLQLVVFGAVAVYITLATAQPQVAIVAHFTGLGVGLFAGRRHLLRESENR